MKIYCSGIGGIGLSAYAALQKKNGHEVLGSDRTESALLDGLRSQGITVIMKQDGSGVPNDADLFVYSEAIPSDAPERVRAKELGIPQKNYFEALGELSDGYTVIAVCGSHGKSSTTAMAADVLIEAGLDPTVVVGTKVPALDGRNWSKGKSNLFLLEACEYRGSFLHLKPSIILLTSVDWDHVDAYPTQESYREAYRKFVRKLPKKGIVITHMNDPECAEIAEVSPEVIDADNDLKKIHMEVPGSHMEQNARLALALAIELGVEADAARRTLENFKGTWRRMEEKGESNGVLIIDDYAHHPKEIEATTAAMHTKYPNRRLVCVFQPHMYSRTEAFYNDFIKAFTGSFHIIVTDVYEARREQAKPANISEKLAYDINTHFKDSRCVYCPSLSDVENHLNKILKTGDVLLFMGAGDITNLATKMVER